jgi:hypothetical protein
MGMTDQSLLELRVEMTAHVEMNTGIQTEGICRMCGGKALQHYTKQRHDTGFYLYTHCQECGQFDTEFIGPDV